MKLGRVVTLRDYKAQRLMRTKKLSEAGAVKALPDAAHLWELLDRNISLEVWKKGA
jgi:hypothetical protein